MAEARVSGQFLGYGWKDERVIGAENAEENQPAGRLRLAGMPGDGKCWRVRV